jgi:hypothetical protein
MASALRRRFVAELWNGLRVVGPILSALLAMGLTGALLAGLRVAIGVNALDAAAA